MQSFHSVQVVAESAMPFGASLPVPADSSPAQAADTSSCAGASRGADSTEASQRCKASSQPCVSVSREALQTQRPEERSRSLDGGTAYVKHPPSASFSMGSGSHADGAPTAV